MERTLPFVTGGLSSSSEDDSDVTALDLSFFCRAYTHIYMRNRFMHRKNGC